jgi:hypothetical protein
LNIELNDLAAGLRTLGIPVVVEQRELLGRGPRELLPEPFDRVVTDAVCQCIRDDPHAFPIRQPVVKAFESLEFLHHGVGHPGTGPCRDALDGVGEHAAHTLRLKTAFEGADRFRMRVRFLCPLGGGAIVEEHQRADDVIAPLNRVAEELLQLVTIRQ